LTSPLDHRSHDYVGLIRRWRKCARSAGLTVREYFAEDGIPYYLLESRRARVIRPRVYLSAGIHGDEAAATEALIAWVTKHGAELRRLDLLIFPCLNPWGLINNARFDSRGVDRNRSYHHDLIPATAAHLRELGTRQFDLALTLHEDYDALGVYLYEIQHKRPYWGDALLQAASRVMKIDDRRRIETSRPRNGVIRRRITPALLEHHPEAFTLHFHHSLRTLTIETPSEHLLSARVDAQIAMIECAIDLLEAIESE
jgi:hypothetical protein